MRTPITLALVAMLLAAAAAAAGRADDAPPAPDAAASRKSPDAPRERRGDGRERPLREARSEDLRYVLRIEPGRVGRADMTCDAVLLHELPGRERAKKVWERPLVNGVAPTHVHIRNDGRFVITLDEFRRGGAQHALVVYGPRGELLRHFVLTDVLRGDDWKHVKIRRRAVEWLDGARLRFDDSKEQFVVELKWGRERRLDLKTMQFVRERGEPADADAAPPDVLALLFGGVSGGEGGDDDALAAASQPAAEALPDGRVDASPAGGAEDVAAADPAAPALEREGAESPASADQNPDLWAYRDAPDPNPADPVNYVDWLNQRGLVDGPDARPLYDAAADSVLKYQGDATTQTAALRGDPAALADPGVQQWLTQNDSAIESFRAASKIDASSWSLNSSDGTMSGVELPNLSNWRELARLTTAQAWEAVAEGRAAEAADGFLDIVAAGAHVGGGPTMIENLVGVAIQSMGAESLLDLQASGAAATLDFEALAREAALAARPVREAPDLVGAERLFALDTLQRIYKPDPASGELVIDAERAKAIWGRTGEVGSQPNPAAMFANTNYGDVLAGVEQFYQGASAALGRPHIAARAELESLESRVPASANPITGPLAPAFSRYSFTRARGDATRRAAVLTAQIHAYRQKTGVLPESLDAVGGGEFAVDPFTGAPFAYRREGDSFVLYSVGANGVDDGGAHDARGEVNDVVFWPRPAR